MRALLLSLVTIACLLCHQPASAMTKEQWQADLKHLHRLISKDYPMLFIKISQDEFDNRVAELGKNIDTMAEHEIKVAFAELVALFGYGHTAIYLHPFNGDPALDFTMIPLQFKWYKDGIFVHATDQKHRHLLGAKVLKIHQTPVLSALNQIRSTISAENDSYFKTSAVAYATSPEILAAKGVIDSLEAVPLTLELNGKTFNVNVKAEKLGHLHFQYGVVPKGDNWVTARKQDKTPLWLKNLHHRYDASFIEDKKTLYVRYSAVRNDPNTLSVKDFFDKQMAFVANEDVEKFVLDLRLNGGGNNGNNREVVLDLIKNDKINQVGKLFVIIGKRTFSAAQNLVNEIETYTNAKFIGEPTAENVNFMGDSKLVVLPNSGLKARLSYLWWQDKDPRDKREATEPDIAVEMTFSDYVNNVDPVLAAVFDSSMLYQAFDEAFKSKDLAAVKQFYQREKGHSYFAVLQFEAALNRWGYELLSGNNVAKAVNVMQFMAQTYPDSSNAWNSYAESLLKSGKKQKAIEYYKKSIELDPDGRIGEHSRSMLARIIP